MPGREFWAMRSDRNEEDDYRVKPRGAVTGPKRSVPIQVLLAFIHAILRHRSERHLKRGGARRKHAVPGSLAAVAAHIALPGDRRIDRLPLAVMSEFHTG